jgi:hypothetical protein
MVKTGSDHRKSLRDGRAVDINSEKVDDVTSYRAFARSAASACSLYDYQAANLLRKTVRSGHGRGHHQPARGDPGRHRSRSASSLRDWTCSEFMQEERRAR